MDERGYKAPPPPPLPRTDRTSLVPPLVLSGHAGRAHPRPAGAGARSPASPAGAGGGGR